MTRRRIMMPAILCLIAVSCKDRPPDPIHEVDSSGASSLARPAGRPWYAAPYKRGDTANWIEFRKPGEAREPASDEAAPTGGVESAVREMIAGYNEVAAEKDYEEMLLYHIEAQQELVKSLYSQGQAMLGKFDDLATSLGKKLPDKKDEIATLFESLKKREGLPYKLSDFAAVNETEATGTLTQGPVAMKCRFVLIDEDWSIEYLDTTLLKQFQQQISMASPMFDQLVAGIESGAVPAEMAYQQLKAMGNMLNPVPAGDEANKPAGDEGG